MSAAGFHDVSTIVQRAWTIGYDPGRVALALGADPFGLAAGQSDAQDGPPRLRMLGRDETAPRLTAE